MDPSKRIVRQIPLDELWDEKGPLAAGRGESVDEAEIKRLLGDEDVKLVVAVVGQPLRWIVGAERFHFWKSEIKPRLATAPRFSLDDFPGAYCYVATSWTENIIVFERHD